jgi:hypothetical protein
MMVPMKVDGILVGPSKVLTVLDCLGLLKTVVIHIAMSNQVSVPLYQGKGTDVSSRHLSLQTRLHSATV